MGVFEFSNAQGQVFEINAPDQNAAIAAFQRYQHERQGGAAQPPADLRPGTREYADWAAQMARRQVANGQHPNLPQVGPRPPEDQSSILDPMAQGLTFGWADEMRGAVQGGLAAMQGGDFGSTYDQVVDEGRNALERERRLNPWGSTTAEIGGGVATTVLGGGLLGALGKGAQVVGAGSRAGNIARGTGATLLPGAFYGAGAADGDFNDRLVGAGTGAALGALGAGVANVGGRVIQGVARRIAQAPLSRANKAAVANAVTDAPTAASIKATSSAAYDASKATGAVIGQPAMQILAHDIGEVARVSGLILPDGTLSGAYPKVAHALQSIGQYAQGQVSMEQAKVLLRTLRTAQKSGDPDEARLGSMLVNTFEDFMDNLPANAFSKNGSKGAEAIVQWTKGRTEWARSKRTQAIEDIISDAQIKGGNFARNLRNGFANILLAKNAKKRRGFSNAELEAIRKFVQGGPVQELLQHLGSGSGIPGGVLGGLAGGVTGAIAVPAVGMGARAIANRGAQRGAELIRAQVATPGGLPPMQALPPPRPLPALGVPGGIGANVIAGEPLRIVINGAGSYNGYR